MAKVVHVNKSVRGVCGTPPSSAQYGMWYVRTVEIELVSQKSLSPLVLQQYSSMGDTDTTHLLTETIT
jgi:hypothetical protein